MIPDSLLAAIIANKSDDVPRLIAADYLDEHGESDYAAFIRVQCELVNCERPLYGDHGGYESNYSQQRRRERSLLFHNYNTWAAEFLRQVGFYTTNMTAFAAADSRVSQESFTRGFVSAITCSWQDWLTHADAILKATPLERVRFTTMPSYHNIIDLTNGYNVQPSQEVLAQLWPGIEFELPRTFERDVMVRHIASQFGVPPHLINPPIYHGTE